MDTADRPQPVLGCGSFGEILEGAPGLFRTLLSQRLKQLERLGIIESAAKPTGRGRCYERTPAVVASSRSAGLDEDLYVTAEAEAFVRWRADQLSWAAALRDHRIQLYGPAWLVRAFPTWNARSMFAHIKPVSASAARAAG